MHPSLPVILVQIWVAIYSAFPYTFNYLVVILFSTVDFWAVLVITQVIAIGPRFVYKYIQSNYYPTDNNIVREMAFLKKKANATDLDNESEFGEQEKTRRMMATPHLDIELSRTPLPFQDSSSSGQQVEMSELHDRRPSAPYEQHQFPPGRHEEDRSHPYDATLSPQKSKGQMGHSAIPIVPSSSSRRQNQAGRSPPGPNQYEELTIGRSPSAPTSPTVRDRFGQVHRERQDSNTPLTPHMYDGTYGSPPMSPGSQGTGHYRLQTGSSGLTRENSSTSFATARSGAETDIESDYGYAR
jgi:hypothetical protein